MKRHRSSRRLGAESLECRQLLAGDFGMLGHFSQGRPDLSGMIAEMQGKGQISAEMIQQLRERLPVDTTRFEQAPSQLSELMTRVQTQLGDIQPTEALSAFESAPEMIDGDASLPTSIRERAVANLPEDFELSEDLPESREERREMIQERVSANVPEDFELPEDLPESREERREMIQERVAANVPEDFELPEDLPESREERREMIRERITESLSEGEGSLRSSSMPISLREIGGQSRYDTYDVNRDGNVAPSDALSIINSLGRLDQQIGAFDESMDVNQDQQLTPLDALLVVNRLERISAGDVASVPVASQAPIANVVDMLMSDDEDEFPFSIGQFGLLA